LFYCAGCGLLFNRSPVMQEVGLSPYPSTSVIAAKASQDRECAVFVQRSTRVGLLLDIGCHDGYFLSIMRDAGWSVRGCEPSSYAEVATRTYGLEVDQALFSSELYRERQFDVVTARNVVCAVPDADRFFRDCYIIMKAGGRLIVENINPQVLLRMDTIALGHSVQNFFGYEHMRRLAERAGFVLAGLQEGDRIRLVFAKSPGGEKSNSILLPPGLGGKDMEQFAQAYWKSLRQIVRGLQRLFRDWKRNKLSVCIYGAGGHTQFILELLNLSNADVRYIVDGDPAKHGKFLAGSKIKILAPSMIRQLGIDVVLVSSTYQEEIIKHLKGDRVEARIVRIYPRPGYVELK